MARVLAISVTGMAVCRAPRVWEGLKETVAMKWTTKPNPVMSSQGFPVSTDIRIPGGSRFHLSKDGFQKLNTFASAAKSIRWGPPSKIMLAKNFFSST
jgi:hypothetical protein